MLGIEIFKIQLTEILNLEAQPIIFITHILHLPRFPEEITPIPALTRGFSFFFFFYPFYVIKVCRFTHTETSKGE